MVPEVAVLIVIIVISFSVRALHKEAVSWGLHLIVLFVCPIVHSFSLHILKAEHGELTDGL